MIRQVFYLTLNILLGFVTMVAEEEMVWQLKADCKV